MSNQSVISQSLSPEFIDDSSADEVISQDEVSQAAEVKVKKTPKKIKVSRPKVKVMKDKAPADNAPVIAASVIAEPLISQDDSRACSPEIGTVTNIPVITTFEADVTKCEEAGLSPVEQSLTESKVICNTQSITSEWRVKQMRLFITARDSGLHAEVIRNRAGDGVMSRAGLEHYEMLVTVADKKNKKDRNGRVSLACNARMLKPVSDLLCNMLNVEEPVLLKAMKEYDYLHYEKATAMYNSQVKTPELEDYFRNDFLNGYLFTDAGRNLIEEAKSVTVSRRKPVTVASVTASAKKMTAADRKAMIAALMALDE